MAFEGIDISIGGSAGSAKAAIASTRSSLASLERSANSTKDSLEELGDDASRTTTKLSGLSATAGATALSLTGISPAGTGASVSLTSLAVSAGTLTTALVGLSAIALPLVATIGALGAAAAGLATAFGAVVGSGLLAFGEERAAQNKQELEQINQRIAELEQLRETEEGLTEEQAKELEQLESKADAVEETTSVTGALKDVLGDLREEIQPLISELGQAFIPLIEDAVDALPTLVESTIDALGPLDEFRDAIRSFGQSAMQAIPQVVSTLVDLGRRALPMLGQLVDVVGGGASAAFDAMLRVAQQVGDDLLQIGQAVGDLLPNLTELGVIIIEAAAPAIERLLGFLDDAIGAFNDFAQSDQAAGLITSFKNAIDATQPAIAALKQGITDVAGAFMTFIQSEDAAEIFRAIEEAIIPLIPRVVDLASEFRPLISELVDNLPEIIRGVGAFADSVLDLANVVLPVIIPPLRLLIDLIGDLAGAYANWVKQSERAESQIGDAIPEFIRERRLPSVGLTGRRSKAAPEGLADPRPGERVAQTATARPQQRPSEQPGSAGGSQAVDVRLRFDSAGEAEQALWDTLRENVSVEIENELRRAGREADNRGIN